MTLPAMMKGFVDKVIFPGVAYEMEDGRLRSRLRNLRQVTVITTMNTPAEIYESIFGNSIEGSLIKGTFHQIGINEVEWISINMVKQSGETKRELWLKDITKRFMRPD
jgi:putative NADPH-quinone reductase